MKSLRGMHDMLFDEANKYQQIIDLSNKISQKYGFTFFKSPTLEETSLFTRNLGQTSDVISKELYSFKDKSNNDISLRPEFTASIMRIYENHNLDFNSQVFTYGSVFRYDRPQKGRYREFSQINFEILNNASYVADATIIKIAKEILDELNINYVLHINTLGFLTSREKYNEKLKDYFFQHYDLLSEDSKHRFDNNAFLRILDSKDEQDKKIIAQISFKILDFLSHEELAFYDNFKSLLNAAQIRFVEDPLLVRGLDYYNNTIFEFISTDLNLTVAGGGRYNAGFTKNVPSVGFAAGIERLILASNLKSKMHINMAIYLLNAQAETYFFKHLATSCSKSYKLFTSEIKLPAFFKKAEQDLCNNILIIGHNEINNEIFEVKNLASKEKFQYNLQELKQIL